MKFCIKCGQKLQDEAHFCFNCGENADFDKDPQEQKPTLELNEQENDNSKRLYNEFIANRKQQIVPEVKCATFGEGIKALFSKFFSFKNKSRRSEFNFGLLFIYIVVSIISFIGVLNSSIMDPFRELISLDTSELVNYDFTKLAVTIPTDIKDSYNIAQLVSSGIWILFMCAPVFRRAYDGYNNRSVATLFTIFFVVGEIVASNICLFIPMSNEATQLIGSLSSAFSIVQLVILLICIFKKSKVVYDFDGNIVD